ncbi:MAG: ribosome rescue protein RqcH [Nitrososphaeraceae archaeon]
MELSSIELNYIIKNIFTKIQDGYYINQIVGVTKDCISLKLHHSLKPDVIVLLSTNAIWITRNSFKSMDDNTIVNRIKTELERSKFVSISQLDGERIVLLTFEMFNGAKRNLIGEFFGHGNIILCDEDMKIISILNPIQVRHRTLKVGLSYIPPPKRGLDVLKLELSDLNDVYDNMFNSDLPRWLGRNLSLPKKFTEEIINRLKTPDMSTGNLLTINMENLYTQIISLRDDILNENKHKPVIIYNDKKEPISALTIPFSNIENYQYEYTKSFMDAIDQVLSYILITYGRSITTVNINKKIQNLEHDLDEQNKAKQKILFKSKSIRNLALALMANGKYDKNNIHLLLDTYESKLIQNKGKYYIKIFDELIPFNINLPKTSSLLYIRAKELERGNESIEQKRKKILEEIDILKKKTYSAHKTIKVKTQITKDWYERYRWFVSSNNLLVIGGRDASSNSAIIRKHLNEKDIVFHAEIHGSPFFVIKNIIGDDNKLKSDIASTVIETAIATVSFSRAWKDGLSSGDSYWVFPSQVKKGAPTGQYLPKGSFVLEGKRNYIKGSELRLAIGLFNYNNRYVVTCGPLNSIRKRSMCYCILLPGGNDPMNISKKIKAEFIKHFKDNDDLFLQLKNFSLDDIIRVLPSGKTKIISSHKGDEQV